jgi:hypothetical protein
MTIDHATNDIPLGAEERERLDYLFQHNYNRVEQALEFDTSILERLNTRELAKASEVFRTTRRVFEGGCW